MGKINSLVLAACFVVVMLIGFIFIGIATARGGNTDWSNLGFYGWAGLALSIFGLFGMIICKPFIKQ